MSDFFQAGPITTLTRLSERPLVEMDEAVARHTRQARPALLVPCLVTELERPARVGEDEASGNGADPRVSARSHDLARRDMADDEPA